MRSAALALAATVVLCAAGRPATAQADGPWRIAEQTPGAQYTKIRHDNGPEINLYRVDQFNGRTPQQFIETTQNDALARAGCAPLARGSARETARGTFSATSAGAQQTCSILLMTSESGAAYALSVDSRKSPVGAHRDAVNLVRGLLAASPNGTRGGAASAGGSGTQPGNASGSGSATGIVDGGRGASGTVMGAAAPATGGAEAQLCAAMAAIPASNRPFGMVLHLESDVVAGGMRFAPYMLFPNGYAVDECRSWNLATTAPTPAALRAAGTDCDVLRWRKIGNKYQLQDTDGEWFEELEELADTRPFRLGQRVDYAVGNVGGASVSGGLSTVNTLNSGELRLTTTGAIEIGAWNSVTYSGVGGVYSSSGQGKNVRGQYLLDGYVVAIRDAAGVISYGLIFLKIESGKPYLYLNGELYWLR
jgi:hypothetical protein